MVATSSLSPRAFDGRGSADCWIVHLERLGAAHEWTQDKMLRMGLVALDGSALTWFDAQPEDEKSLTWPDITLMLRKKYGRTRPDLEEELRRVRQARSLQEYIERFREFNKRVPDSFLSEEAKL